MSEQPKSATPAQEQSYPAPAIAPYPHQSYNPTAFPPPPPGPGAYAPPIFAYPPPPEGSQPEGQNPTAPAPPYVIPFPPGLVYAYPPHPQAPGFGPPPPNSPSSSAARPKRKQVKMACTNCANACKRCDENRPCERCVKYGTADSCVDGIRKERKKGVKRGPYKRKSKEQGETDDFNSSEWPNGQPPPPPPAAPATPSAAPSCAPEGYYHVYYPPPGAFIPHPPDGQPGPEGAPPHANGQHVIPYFIPGPYAPFHYPQLYPHPPPAGAVPPNGTPSSSQPTLAHTSGQPPLTTINPADTSRKPDDPPTGAATAVVDPALAAPVATGVATKKRSRTTKSGEQKTKKAKTGGTSREKSRNDEPSVPQSALNDGENSG